ncbi:hypothetical protein D3C71_1471680 [compost metagenome]
MVSPLHRRTPVSELNRIPVSPLKLFLVFLKPVSGRQEVPYKQAANVERRVDHIHALDVLAQHIVRNIDILIAEHREEQTQHAYGVQKMIQTLLRLDGQRVALMRQMHRFEGELRQMLPEQLNIPD